jgi:hypothetical protein
VHYERAQREAIRAESMQQGASVVFGIVYKYSPGCFRATPLAATP